MESAQTAVSLSRVDLDHFIDGFLSYAFGTRKFAWGLERRELDYYLQIVIEDVRYTARMGDEDRRSIVEFLTDTTQKISKDLDRFAHFRSLRRSFDETGDE